MSPCAMKERTCYHVNGNEIRESDLLRLRCSKIVIRGYFTDMDILKLLNAVRSNFPMRFTLWWCIDEIQNLFFWHINSPRSFSHSKRSCYSFHKFDKLLFKIDNSAFYFRSLIFSWHCYWVRLLAKPRCLPLEETKRTVSWVGWGKL